MEMDDPQAALHRRSPNEQRPRFAATAAEVGRLTARFVSACAIGDRRGLLELLEPDVALIGDGSGRAAGAPRVVAGRELVALRVLRFSARAPLGQQVRLGTVGAQAGAIVYRDGRLWALISLAIADGRIHAIYFVNHPARLTADGPSR